MVVGTHWKRVVCEVCQTTPDQTRTIGAIIRKPIQINAADIARSGTCNNLQVGRTVSAIAAAMFEK